MDYADHLDHLPGWLSVFVPTYKANYSALMCPVGHMIDELIVDLLD